MAFELTNPRFATGDLTGWSFINEFIGAGAGIASVSTERPFTGAYSGKWKGTVGSNATNAPSVVWLNNQRGPVQLGQSVTVSAILAQQDTGSSQNYGAVRLYWLDAADNVVGYKEGNRIAGNFADYRTSTVTDNAPAGAVYCALGVWTRANNSGGMLIGDVSWNFVSQRSLLLTYPVNGTTYAEGTTIPLRVVITGDAPDSVQYVAVNTVTSVPTVLATSTTAPFAENVTGLTAGTYTVTATATYDGGNTVVSNVNNLIIGVPPAPVTREFKASNAYTYLVGENFNGLASSLPPTAVITGCQVELDYYVRALIRAKDFDVSAETSRYEAAFDMVPSGTFGIALLDGEAGTYAAVGTPITQTAPIDRSVFTVVEDGTSEGKRWTVLDGDPTSTVVGDSTTLFGATSMTAAEFVSKGVGVRFFPNLAAKPDYADSGDACFRMNINKLRLSVYFDAGSVEYYFASPDGTQVIRGELAAYCVDDGSFANGDASGDLQLTPALEVMDGSQTFIGADWTIHSQYPPDDENKIGDVVESVDNGAGMRYNGLPAYKAVVDNRSRYVIISANFYGDQSLDSMYGAHGLPRAFAYNGEFFYKICTQPDPAKDSPRHVAYHQGHLALGYKEGRVDISVAGQPYNFDGALGASSWAVGDSVVGLLPLSGTILGIFCSKSIVGISGTTVDNFATQTLSPNIGAIEYTTTDMGFPVYANAYGVYTLSQVQQYGDYMGTPLSQPISPWLRPRLIRKVTSDKEVVVTWPVRSKNQYRLAFSDGYVVSMTLNNGQQSAPTWSFQKYFWDNGGTYSDPDLLTYPGMVPAAVSSQLDVSGEERIHIAPYRIVPSLIDEG